MRKRYIITQISDESTEIWKGKKVDIALAEFFNPKLRKPVNGENEFFTLLLEKSEEDEYETVYQFIMECDYNPDTLQLETKKFTFEKDLFESIREVAIKNEITELIDIMSDETNYKLLLRDSVLTS